MSTKNPAYSKTLFVASVVILANLIGFSAIAQEISVDTQNNSNNSVQESTRTNWCPFFRPMC
jgi:hypothetical protein